jgi:MoaA/NifB/PqqE/SkfB family radical SAM enzyme
MKTTSDQEKFLDPYITNDGKERAWVELERLETLWINTGTLCNLSCPHCYIESSPKNDQLSFFKASDLKKYIVDIKKLNLKTKCISFTGGEPFINPEIREMIELTLSEGFECLVLTNATHIIKRHYDFLKSWCQKYGASFKLRVSLDHFQETFHDLERGKGMFQQTIDNLKELSQLGVHLSIAGRSLFSETPDEALEGYLDLIKKESIFLGEDPGNRIVIFPEMSLENDVPEITTECWDILNKDPREMMCSHERMVVKRKGESGPKVLPCTLLAYDQQFELGESLESSFKKVSLNHPFCAQFCVLGGASCSS